MNTMWKGSISFGMVNIPVKMFAATEEKDIRFRMLHKEYHVPIKYKKTCEQCEGEVTPQDIVKGYEYEPDHYVIVEENEIENITPKTRKTIEIVDFVDLKEIDPIYFDKSYYLSPHETGDKAYALLRSAMENTGKIGIAKITIRSKQNLACVRVYGNSIVLETLYYPDEVRGQAMVPGLLGDLELSEKELTMAQQLIEQLTTSFDPSRYKDEYREQLEDLIRKKMEGETVGVNVAAPQAKVVDLMEALKASLDAAKKDKKQTTAAAPKKRGRSKKATL
ncbi:MAG TPA: Ku protein [Paenibacillaceae bacterium]|nr:Ku protein [Paenibacillaceae bacterium]